MEIEESLVAFEKSESPIMSLQSFLWNRALSRIYVKDENGGAEGGREKSHTPITLPIWISNSTSDIGERKKREEGREGIKAKDKKVNS